MTIDVKDYLFRSKRLGFRNWRAEDIPEMAAISADPEVMRFFPCIQDQDHTRNFVSSMQEHFEKFGYCYFAVDVLSTRSFIGFIGLKWIEMGESAFTDIGWRLAPTSWGKGYATEGALRCLEYGFDDLGMDQIFAIAPSINTASIAVMKKAGMHFERAFDHPLLLDNERLRNCVLYVRRKESSGQTSA